MEDLDAIERQKAELESVLSSDAFRRAPNLTRLLRFVCQKHWEGKGGEIKEYTLAVEVLGRPPDFDPLTNSIVRVELHRLREKLEHYYQDPAHRHELKIHLRSGTYVPEFLPPQSPGGNGDASQALSQPTAESRENGSSALASRELGMPAPLTATAPRDKRHRPRRFSLGLLAAGLSVGGILMLSLWGWWVYRFTPANLRQPRPAPSPGALASPTRGQEMRIMAGYTKGKSYVDRLGDTWLSDQYFDSGGAISFPRQVTALATDPALFETARWGRFSYSVPLSPGSYVLRLYFMERVFGPGGIGQGGESSRLFDVSLNGKTALSLFDPYSDAGGNLIGHIRAFKGVTPGPDGFLRIKFDPGRDEPFVNAIEIIPTPDGRVPPIRIVAQENSVTDARGQVWQPDRYYRGGILLRRHSGVTGTADPDLYSGERFGHFSYVIPVPEGSYGLTLRFAEAYFGSQDQGVGGAGSRVFDVYCNGQALLRDLDVFREAGGGNRALVKSFHGLKPNAQGQLALDFVPVQNYAVINAIEVVDESEN
jgi:hypothetical protein